MLALPPVAPVLGGRSPSRLPRDYYVRLDSNDYSVHPSMIGRRVEINADLDTVTITCAGRRVALHDRCWARHQSITDPDHRAAAQALPKLPRTAKRPVIDEVKQRSLSDYDQVFGVAEEVTPELASMVSSPGWASLDQSQNPPRPPRNGSATSLLSASMPRRSPESWPTTSPGCPRRNSPTSTA
jgi:hypothetical protein